MMEVVGFVMGDAWERVGAALWWSLATTCMFQIMGLLLLPLGSSLVPSPSPRSSLHSSQSSRGWERA